MKRVLSLVLVLVMVLSAIVPVFAEETASQEALDLQSYGLITGNGTDLDEASQLTRAEMTVILAKLYGKATEAEAYDIPNTLTDIEDHWAKAWISYSFDNEWMVGDVAGTFRPEDPISAQEVNTLMLKVLGYFVSWDDANADAEAQGIAVDAADASLVIRGEIFKTLRAALDMPKKDATDTLGTELALTDYVAPVVTPETLELTSVTALNAKQVELKFNQEVTASTLTATNVKVYLGTATTTTDYTKVVLEDGMTVILGLDAQMAQDTTVKVVAKDVENAAEEKLAETTLTATLKDITAPAVLSAKFTSSKTLEIMTTEPLELESNANSFHVLPNILVDGVKLVGKVTQDVAANKITVEFGAKVAVGEHKIKVQNYTDFVKWVAPTVELDAEVVADTTGPVITSVDANRGTVTIVFDEPVNTIGTVTINATDYDDTDAANASGDKMTWKITLDSGKELGLAFLIAGEISYYNSTDVEGNKTGTAAAPSKFAFTANDDTEVPTATVELDAANNVIITFSEAVSDPGKVKITNSSDKVVKKDVVPVVKTAATYVYKVSAVDAGLDAQATAANFTVELKEFKDDSVRTNVGATSETAVISNDIVKPVVTSVILTEKGTYTNSAGTEATVNGLGGQASGTGLKETKAATVTIYFSEAMDADTVTDLSNYLITIGATEYQGTAISGLTATAASDGKSVALKFPGTVNTAKTTYDAGIDSNDTLKVLLVKDAIGNTISTDATSTDITFNESATITNGPNALATAAIGGTAAYSAQNYAFTAGNTLIVGFNNAITSLSPSDFTIYDVDDAKTVLVGINYSLSASGKVATITLNGSVNSDGTYGTAKNDIRVDISDDNLTDIYSQKLAADVNQAFAAGMDYMAPSIKDVTIKADTETGNNIIELIFDEEVYASDANIVTDLKIMVQASTPYQLPVADYSVDSTVVGSPEIIEVTISATDIDSKVTVELLNNRYLEDDNADNDDYATATDNKANVFAATTVQNAADSADFVVDTKVPTASIPADEDADTNDSDSLVITLSEALHDSTTHTALADGADVSSYLDETNMAAGAVDTATYDLDTLTITIVFDGSVADGDSFDLDLDTLEDDHGNDGAAAITYTIADATADWN